MVLPLSYYIASGFINFVTALTMGIVVLKNKESFVNRIFSTFSFSVAFWSFFYFLWLISANNKPLAEFFIRTCMIAVLFMPSLFIHFVSRFLELKKNRLFFLINYLMSFGVALTVYTRLYATEIGRHLVFPYWPKAGPLFHIALLHFSVIVCYSFILLFQKLRASSGRHKNQILYVFIGTLLGYIGGSTNYFSWYRINIPPFLNIFVSLYVLFIAYAIVRHRLMDLEVVINRALVYSITSSVVVGGFIIIIPPLEALCQWLFGYTARAVGIFVAGAAGFTFIPIRNRVQKIIDKFFYRARYDYRKELREFTRSLITIRDPEELAGLIVDRISNAMKLSRCSLILREEMNGGYRLKALAGLGSQTMEKERLSESDFLIRLQRHWKRVMVREDSSLMTPENAKRFGDEMTAIGADLTAPLLAKGKLVGMLCLGNKMSGHMFSDEDMDLLATLADEAAIAIENATLYKRILDGKNYTEGILENMTSGVVTIDLDGNITALNRAAVRLTNVKSGWLGESVRILREELSRPILKALLENRRYSNYEINILSDKKETVPLGVSTSLLKDFEGNKIGAIMVFNDLSERKQMENEMRRMDRLASLGTLAAGMAHEIKNPLSSIKTFTQLLPEKLDDPEFRGDFLAIASKEVDRIDYLINQLLNFARPSKPQFERVDIALTLNDSIAIIDNQIRKKNITVVREFGKEEQLAYADERQLKQVFINIMMNAIQAMEEKGTLTIEVKQPSPKMHQGAESEFLQVLIRDTGKGISEENLDKLFNPFFTTKHDGTGLGLAIVHRIIEDHRGFIEVSSKVGMGTTFTINLLMGQIAATEGEPDIRSKEKGYGFGLGKTA